TLKFCSLSELQGCMKVAMARGRLGENNNNETSNVIFNICKQILFEVPRVYEELVYLDEEVLRNLFPKTLQKDFSEFRQTLVTMFEQKLLTTRNFEAALDLTLTRPNMVSTQSEHLLCI